MSRIAIALLLCAGVAVGGIVTFSETGTLAHPEEAVVFQLTLSNSGTVTLQTFSFGGGVNASSTSIPAGGFDPFVALFQGTGAGAVLVDGPRTRSAITFRMWATRPRDSSPSVACLISAEMMRWSWVGSRRGRIPSF